MPSRATRGEEFAVALPDAAPEELAAGVAGPSGHADPLAAADVALYAAKRGGCDRACLA